MKYNAADKVGEELECGLMCIRRMMKNERVRALESRHRMRLFSLDDIQDRQYARGV